MDKKNTILLTVIAVATLLVAVVGATFAYYSVATTNSTSKITVNAKADPVGAITLYSPNTELGMTITPTDMAQFNEDRHYYALIPTADNEADETTTVGRYATKQHNYTMAHAVLVGGNEETGYTCTAQLKITLNTPEGSMGKVLQEGDAMLYFTTHQTTMKRSDETDYKNTQTLDLSKIKGEGNTAQFVYDIIYKVNGNNVGKNREANIYADLEINNKTNKDQKYLAGASKGEGLGTAGATLTVYIESTDFNCTIDPEKAS